MYVTKAGEGVVKRDFDKKKKKKKKKKTREHAYMISNQYGGFKFEEMGWDMV